MKKSDLSAFFNKSAGHFDRLAKSDESLKMMPFLALGIAPFDMGLATTMAVGASAMGAVSATSHIIAKGIELSDRPANKPDI